ncbi:hypothetical protein BO83DRAFT_394319 [Aspergillus eucalypticola CBS 122712]|uniref:Uncharacterized protein n=1 Tax=Aspergillus eucalypticola (strain CBS 122712 / IBT 29274) TaxID=1448314 RepID=A0A317UIT4_ASPEC|nr:uncharacterized protein BO83DRAFT_394319 [Aspergillus eucalypticola CBS 122712]PWY62004.1 hypothetical protein BO83DRAFT_394319 [Aspergillus eucalypticola CBS 122712]
MLVKPRKSSLENTSPIMLGSKGWGSLFSCVLVTVCISPAIVAQCLVKDVQMPSALMGVPYCSGRSAVKLTTVLSNEGSRLDIPMDHYSQPSDKAFSIPIIRMLAKNASASGDRHIFLNPGGPGASGVGFLRGSASDLNKLIGEHFHLLSFDPRGASGSVPKAVCFASNAERTAAFASNPWDLQFQAGEMYTKVENETNACKDMMGEYGRYINTPQIAADMDMILDAIGQQKMFYWGLSFPERKCPFWYQGIKDLISMTEPRGRFPQPMASTLGAILGLPGCGIDADYFPSARRSAVSTLSVEEEDLLGSLHELATKGVFLIKGQV